MSLVYVTGIEAAGKTTTCQELKKRGYEAYDIDEGIAHFYNVVTGKQARWVDSPTGRSEAWYNQHEYMMERSKVEQLVKKAKDTTIFLCGTTRLDFLVIDVFDQIIYLYLDEATLRQRLSMRQSFEWGSAPYERDMILAWHKPTEDDYKEYGATMIDATQSVASVVDEILAAADL